MRFSAKRVVTSSWGLVAVLLMMAVGGLTASAAPGIRFVGTGSFPPEVPSFAFTVDLDPGKSATWEWRFRNIVLASGFLSGTQSGSNVTGTLFLTGGVVFDPPFCCAPCDFTAVVTGSRVDGALDPVSCGGPGTFALNRV